MTTIALTYRAIHKKINAVSLPRVNLPKINWKIFYVAGTILLFSMLVLYVYLINEITMDTYIIKNYNREINSLLEENKKLGTKFTKTGLLREVMNRATNLSFEKTINIKYIQVLDTSVAKAQ